MFYNYENCGCVEKLVKSGRILRLVEIERMVRFCVLWFGCRNHTIVFECFINETLKFSLLESITIIFHHAGSRAAMYFGIINVIIVAYRVTHQSYWESWYYLIKKQRKLVLCNDFMWGLSWKLVLCVTIFMWGLSSYMWEDIICNTVYKM